MVVYPHMPILRLHAVCCYVFGSQRVIVVNSVEVVAQWPLCPILGSGGAKFPKMCDSLPWTPMNCRTKFDAASFILGREVCNCTDKQTNIQTVNDISTPCLSACVNNNGGKIFVVCE